MASTQRQRYSSYWEETECLSYYGMMSLHDIFEVVGSQLTEIDVEVLSFLLEETYTGRHPLDPAGWTADVCGENLDVVDTSQSPRILEAWHRLQPRGSPCPSESRHRPKSGVDLLLELEKRGYLSEGNLEPLMQLLRVLTRHDLLPFVSRKKRRTVSPERHSVVTEDQGDIDLIRLADNCGQTNTSEDCLPQQWRAGVDPSRQMPSAAGRKRCRGRRPPRVDGSASCRRTADLPQVSVAASAPQEKITCEKWINRIEALRIN